MKLDDYRLTRDETDRRVKIKLEDHDKIRAEYATGTISQRGLAGKYNVSRRLITFILYPERLAEQKELYKERRKDGRYYDREKHNEAIKSLRAHKKSLMSHNIES